MAMAQTRHTARRQRTIAAIAGVSLLSMAGVGLAPVAGAQPPALIVKLKANVKCSERDAGKQLMRNAASSGAALDDLLAALEDISLDRNACVAIRDAASDLGLDLAHEDPAPSPEETPAVVALETEADPQADLAAAAAARMQEVLAEADRRAAAMRFEVGPPPRNLTRSRAVPR